MGWLGSAAAPPQERRTLAWGPPSQSQLVGGVSTLGGKLLSAAASVPLHVRRDPSDAGLLYLKWITVPNGPLRPEDLSGTQRLRRTSEKWRKENCSHPDYIMHDEQTEACQTGSPVPNAETLMRKYPITGETNSTAATS